MGWFDKPVTDKELRDFRRGKPVREAVATEAAKRNGGGKKSAAAIRGHVKKNVTGGRYKGGVTQQDLDGL